MFISINEKKKNMLRNILRLNVGYLKFTHILHPRYYLKLIAHILKNKQKNNCVCIHEIIGLITMKMQIFMKNRSYRNNINGSGPRHKHYCSKYKTFVSMIMLIIVKQPLSNIWSSIHEKVKQQWDWVEKKRCL